MMHALLYYALFFGAVGAIAGGSWLVWRAFERSGPEPKHLYEAFRYVWVDCYEMDWEQRPRLIFVHGRSFNCAGQEVAGMSQYNAITVAMEDDDTPLSSTAFAHELRHQARARKGLPTDPGHKAPDWAPGGIVARTNEELRKRGW